MALVTGPSPHPKSLNSKIGGKNYPDHHHRMGQGKIYLSYPAVYKYLKEIKPE